MQQAKIASFCLMSKMQSSQYNFSPNVDRICQGMYQKHDRGVGPRHRIIPGVLQTKQDAVQNRSNRTAQAKTKAQSGYMMNTNSG